MPKPENRPTSRYAKEAAELLGLLIRRARIERKMTAEEVAERAGMSRGLVFFRESAVVLEPRGSWARITKYYDGSCTDGRSDYVDSGNAQCSTINGFDNDQFAEWVSLDLLVADRPPDPAQDAGGSSALVAASNDFRLHEAAFVAAAKKLMSDGTCTAANFREMGGWIRP